MTEALALALLHFVWQGAVIAAIAAVLFRAMRRPETRYIAGCAAMALMALVPLVTLLALHPEPAESAGAAMPAVFFVALPVPAGEAGSQWLSVVPALWAIGATAFLLRAAGGFVLAARHVHACRPAGAKWQSRAEAIAARLGVRRAIRLVESVRAGSPSVYGFVRPVIVMPVSALTGLTAEQIEAVLAHELAHIRRRDFIVNCIQTLIESLLFYHPAVWWLSARVRDERELCCDNVAVNSCGDPIVYSRALLTLEETRQTLLVAASGGSLRMRIERLFGREPRTANALPLVLAAVLAVGVAGSLTAFPQDPPPPPPPPPAVPAEQPAGERRTLRLPPPPARPQAPATDVEELQRAAEELERLLEDRPAADALRDRLTAVRKDLELLQHVPDANDEELARAHLQLETSLAQLRAATAAISGFRPVPPAPPPVPDDPDARRAQNLASSERERRIQYAKQRFGGHDTPRGRIYIQNGPPSEIESHPSGPKEIWRYPKGVEYEFQGPKHELVRFRFEGKDFR